MLKNFFLMMIGVISFIIITIHNSSQYGASLSWMLPSCVLIMVGYVTTKRKKEYVAANSLILFWVVIFISTIVSTTVSFDRDVFTLLFFFIIVLISNAVDYRSSEIKIINKVYILSSVICSCFVVKNYLTGDFYNDWYSRASYSFLGQNKDPNYVCSYLVPAVYLCLFSIIAGKNKKNKICYGLLASIILLAIIFTGSRSSLIALLLSVAFYFLFDDNLKSGKKVGLITLGMIFLVMLYYLFVTYMPSTSIDRFLNSAEDDRLLLWTAGLKGFWDNPLFGSGLGASNELSIKLAGNYSHSVLIDILSSSGILGALCFMHYLYKSCLKTTAKNRQFLLSLCVVFYVPLLFINGFNTATFMTPLMYMSIISKYCNKKGNKATDLA